MGYDPSDLHDENGYVINCEATFCVRKTLGSLNLQCGQKVGFNARIELSPEWDYSVEKNIEDYWGEELIIPEKYTVNFRYPTKWKKLKDTLGKIKIWLLILKSIL